MRNLSGTKLSLPPFLYFTREFVSLIIIALCGRGIVHFDIKIIILVDKNNSILIVILLFQYSIGTSSTELLLFLHFKPLSISLDKWTRILIFVLHHYFLFILQTVAHVPDELIPLRTD